MSAQDRWIRTPPRKSATFDDYTIAEIRRAAATGIYDIRGAGTKRRLPHFDDLLFLGASISRYPLEGYRERCGTAGRIAASVGTPTCSMNTSCVAAVPPCMPSRTTTSAPAFAASAVS